MPKAPGQRVKTNRLDRRGLAETLRGGHRKSLQGPAAVYRELRHLSQRRDPCGRARVAMKHRRKSRVLLEGSECPPAPAGSQGSLLGKDNLRQRPCSTTVGFKLEQWLARLAFNEKQVGKATKESRRFCQHAPELVQGIK
jgi:hypothetical protein